MPSLQTTVAYAAKSATISSAAKAISHADFAWGASDLEAAELAIVGARTAGIMVTFHGADPTATFGHSIDASGEMEVIGNGNIKAMRFIREGSVDSVVTVTLEKF